MGHPIRTSSSPSASSRRRCRRDTATFVYLYIDALSGKIVGSARLSKHLDTMPADYAPGSKVSCIVTEQHELGYRCVIEDKHWGTALQRHGTTYAQRGERMKHTSSASAKRIIRLTSPSSPVGLSEGRRRAGTPAHDPREAPRASTHRRQEPCRGRHAPHGDEQEDLQDGPWLTL